MASDSGNNLTNNLAIGEAEINSSIKSLSILSAVTGTYTKCVSVLSTSLNFLRSDFIDLSLGTAGLAVEMDPLSSGFTGLIRKSEKAADNINSMSNELLNLSCGFSGVTDDVTNLTSGFKDVSKDVKSLSSRVSILSDDFSDLKDNINKVSTNKTDLSKTKDQVNELKNSTDKMNKKLKDTKSEAKKAKSGLNMVSNFAKSTKTAFSSFGFDKLKSGMDVFDQYIKASNGLAKVNDGTQSQPDLLNKVNAAATRSSVSNNDMTTAVTDIGSLDTFSNDNDQAIVFSELMQKSLKIDGSELGLTDISKNLSDGMLQGDEFDSLIASAPMVGNAMSEWTGKSTTQLKEMAAQGLITADMLKNSMFLVSDDINKKFGDQPKTFADIWMQIKNSALNALNPLMQLISDIFQSNAFQGGLNLIIAGLGWISGLVSSLVDFITSNGTLIQSLLMALGAVLIGVLAASVVSWLMMFWPILLIIGAITAIIFIVTQLGVSFQDIFSFIGGVVGTFGAYFYNLFVYLWNFIAAFVNFFGNAFNNSGASIKVLFLDLVSNILGALATAAKGIEKLLSFLNIDVGFSDKIDALKQNIETEITTTKNNAQLKTFVETKDYMDYADGAAKGSEYGVKAYEKANVALDTITDVSGFGIDKYTDDKGTTATPAVVEGTGSNGSVDVDMEDEDLGYLRDMAERDYIANIATNTLAPNISVSFGEVHETADVNQLFGRIQAILKEQIAIAPEGVY